MMRMIGHISSKYTVHIMIFSNEFDIK